jgi:acyl-CoA-binding protein
MKAPKAGVPRTGDFSATGEYKWYAFAEQPGPIQEQSKYEVLDLRRKVRPHWFL